MLRYLGDEKTEGVMLTVPLGTQEEKMRGARLRYPGLLGTRAIEKRPGARRITIDANKKYMHALFGECSSTSINTIQDKLPNTN